VKVPYTLMESILSKFNFNSIRKCFLLFSYECLGFVQNVILSGTAKMEIHAQHVDWKKKSHEESC